MRVWDGSRVAAEAQQDFVKKDQRQNLERDDGHQAEEHQLPERLLRLFLFLLAEKDRNDRSRADAAHHAERRDDDHDWHRQRQSRQRLLADAVADIDAVNQVVKHVDDGRYDRRPRQSQQQPPDVLRPEKCGILQCHGCRLYDLDICQFLRLLT